MITSAANEKLKLVRKLQSERWREKLGLFVAEGEDLVEAARSAGIEPVELLVAGDNVAPERLAAVYDLPHPPRVVAMHRRADLPCNKLLQGVALWRCQRLNSRRAAVQSRRQQPRRSETIKNYAVQPSAIPELQNQVKNKVHGEGR